MRRQRHATAQQFGGLLQRSELAGVVVQQAQGAAQTVQVDLAVRVPVGGHVDGAPVAVDRAPQGRQVLGVLVEFRLGVGEVPQMYIPAGGGVGGGVDDPLVEIARPAQRGDVPRAVVELQLP